MTFLKKTHKTCTKQSKMVHLKAKSPLDGAVKLSIIHTDNQKILIDSSLKNSYTMCLHLDIFIQSCRGNLVELSSLLST